jgi:transcription antitermination factor NusG
MADWHVWSIAQQRYRRVQEFLENLPDIEDYFYPTVIKEYQTKSGRKTKDVPLFSNYIFIKYIPDIKTQLKISDNPWIKEYVGKCSQKEMDEVLVLSKKKYEDLVERPSEIQKGSSYKLTGTPFKDMFCRVVEIKGNKLVVAVQIFGSDRLIKCTVDDIDMEG